MVSSATRSRIATAPWFNTAFAPFALLSQELDVVEVNPAFERATGAGRHELIGVSAADALALAPDDPSAAGGARVAASLRRAVQGDRADWVGPVRYDLPDPAVPGGSSPRCWLSVNLPVTEEGEVAAVLLHAQDVTSAVLRPAGGLDDTFEWSSLDPVCRRLHREFPGSARAEVLGVLTDSFRVVLDVVGAPDPEKTVELARLRLEVRTRAAAVTVPDTERSD
jgi:hypothetical protein